MPSSVARCSMPWCKRGVYEKNDRSLCKEHVEIWRTIYYREEILKAEAAEKRRKRGGLIVPGE